MGTEMNVEAERAAPCPFCAVVLKGDAVFYEHPKNNCFFSEWEFDRLDVAKWNLRAAQPADVGAGELPPLPEPDSDLLGDGQYPVWREAQVRQAQRDAIAADRRARQSQGEPDAYLIRDNIGNHGWSKWTPCSTEEYKLRKPHADIFQFRALYAAPPLSSEQQAGLVQVPREILERAAYWDKDDAAEVRKAMSASEPQAEKG